MTNKLRYIIILGPETSPLVLIIFAILLTFPTTILTNHISAFLAFANQNILIFIEKSAVNLGFSVEIAIIVVCSIACSFILEAHAGVKPKKTLVHYCDVNRRHIIFRN